MWILVLLLIGLLFPQYGYAKICTNVIDDGVSHTLRSRHMNRAQDPVSRHAFFKNATFVIGYENYEKSRRSMKEQEKFLEGPSLHRVRIASDSPQGIAQQTNLNYLLLLEVDRLVYNFRVAAGLNASGAPYGGWEAPSSELRGHFVGHYLSASALMWASTHNLQLHDKMNAVVDALEECQKMFGTGYLSAFPSSFFDRFEALEPVWAPYYTIHKIMAGLLDQYSLAGSQKTLKIVLEMADYFSNRVESVIKKHTVERHWQSLNEETGGMNDVLYQLYQITKNEKHLKLAHLFDKPCFLGVLAVKADSLSGFHSNTHIPIVVGAQKRYEITGDWVYKDIATYFMDVVNASHVYATGGTSAGEFWYISELSSPYHVYRKFQSYRTDPDRLASSLSTENEESCTTYNMLKVARNLLRWTKKVMYADYYERAVLNGILTIQRGNEPGVMIYMLPLSPGSSKAVSYHGWGTRYDSFWCCYGTGIEAFSKLGDSIYFEESGGDVPALYITQFVSSTLDWESAGVKIKQEVQPLTSFNPVLSTTLKIVSEISVAQVASIYVRIPTWSTTCHVYLNGRKLQDPVPGIFLKIERIWMTGDELSISFGAAITTERIKDDRKMYRSTNAVFFGPYLLGGLSDGDWKIGPVNISAPSDWIVPVHPSYATHLYTFAQHNTTSFRVLGCKNGRVSMVHLPAEGTDGSLQSTFRIASPATGISQRISQGISGNLASDLIFRVVSLELVGHPGKFLSHYGVGEKLRVVDHYHHEDVNAGLSSVFQVLPGLSGDPNSISFEAAGSPGCFIFVNEDAEVKCMEGGIGSGFVSATSFFVTKGLWSYNSISFIAYGSNRTYLMFPLNAFKDEHYSVYFDME